MINKWDQKIEVGKKKFSRAEFSRVQRREEKKREREEVADAGSNKRARSAIFDRLGDRGPVSAKLKRANQAVLEAKSEAIEAERQELEQRLN